MTGRDRIVVMVVAAVALLGAFWFLAVSPKRAEVKAVDAKIATAQQRLEAARSSVATAQQAKRDYDTDYAAVARLGKAVPLDDNVPSLIYQLQSASHSSKVDFRSLKLESSGASAPVAPAATAAATPATPPDASKSGSSSSSSSTPAPAPAAGATPAPATQLAAAALPPGATVGAAGFPTMPFTFIFDGSFFDMEHMLRDVNRFITVDGKSVSVRGRLLAVDGFSLEAAPSGFPAVTATLRATAYLLPAGQGLTAGATATAPAAVGTPAAPAASTASTAGATPAPPTAAATGVK